MLANIIALEKSVGSGATLDDFLRIDILKKKMKFFENSVDLVREKEENM